MKELLNTSINKAISYESYRELVNHKVSEGKTTGPSQTEALAEYTRLNDYRMRRLDKTINLQSEAIAVIKEIEKPLIWLVLTEGWCGDAAQVLPVIHAMAQHNSKIELKILLRDENLELMDHFLTNNGRSIPKLIIIDPTSLDVLGDWGPRPESAQKLYQGLRNNQELPYSEINVSMQNWYNSNKALDIQQEFTNKLKTLDWEKLSEIGI